MHRFDTDVYTPLVRSVAEHAGIGKTEAHKLAMSWEGFLSLRFAYQPQKASGANWEFNIYAHHGFGGGRKAGSHALTLEDAMGRYAADLLLMGHRHVREVQEHTVVAPDARRGFKLETRYGAWCGSYLRPYIEVEPGHMPRGHYAQRKGLPPRAPGGLTISIRPFDREMTVHLNGHWRNEAESIPMITPVPKRARKAA
jgi:hypothetical protein